MALVKCKKCGNLISDKADICPKCRTPRESAHYNNNFVPPIPPVISKEKRGLSGWMIALIIFGVLIVIGGLGYCGWLMWWRYQDSLIDKEYLTEDTITIEEPEVQAVVPPEFKSHKKSLKLPMRIVYEEFPDDEPIEYNIEVSYEIDWPESGSPELVSLVKKHILDDIKDKLSKNVEDENFHVSLSYDINDIDNIDIDRQLQQWINKWYAKEKEYQGMTGSIDFWAKADVIDNEFLALADEYYYHPYMANGSRPLYGKYYYIRISDGKELESSMLPAWGVLQQLIFAQMKKNWSEWRNAIGNPSEIKRSELIMEPMFTKDGLYINFGPYTLNQPGSYGQVDFTIPYEELKGYLSDEAKEFVPSSKR